MKLEFYKCAHCGNVAVKLFDQGVPLSCCGEEMTLLRAGETDGAAEKHVPVVTVGETIHVEVGSVLHPMMEAHFITMIVLETSKGFQVKHLQPGEAEKSHGSYHADLFLRYLSEFHPDYRQFLFPEVQDKLLP